MSLVTHSALPGGILIPNSSGGTTPRYEAAYQGNLGAALCIPPDPARKVVIRYDKYGFRNTRDLQESDVVVIGDSYMEGYLTSEAKLVTARLSDLLGKPPIWGTQVTDLNKNWSC